MTAAPPGRSAGTAPDRPRTPRRGAPRTPARPSGSPTHRTKEIRP
jgi:hypothetical protein